MTLHFKQIPIQNVTKSFCSARIFFKSKNLAWFFLCLVLSISVQAQAALENTKKEEPIEIDADALEVFQDKQQAIFSGNVRAIQGNTRLSADKMVVFYKSKEGQKSAPKSEDDATAGPGSSIERIEVEGNVFLATPKETAQGKRGNYELKNNMIYLYDNVVLTSGSNTIRGDSLVHNRKTSRSKVSANNNLQPGKKQRVKSVFVSESAEEKQSNQ